MTDSGTDRKTTDELIGRAITGVSDEDALAHIGGLIDFAVDTHSAPLTNRALELLDELQSRQLGDELVSLAHYFRSNAWSNRHEETNGEDVWAWNQAERRMQIIELRRAMRHPGFESLGV